MGWRGFADQNIKATGHLNISHITLIQGMGHPAKVTWEGKSDWCVRGIYSAGLLERQRSPCLPTVLSDGLAKKT